jgi:hypothetical protein
MSYEYPPEEHCKRIQRWRQRLREVRSDAFADFLDDAVVVLLHCFSMRDWLINFTLDLGSELGGSREGKRLWGTREVIVDANSVDVAQHASNLVR